MDVGIVLDIGDSMKLQKMKVRYLAILLICIAAVFLVEMPGSATASDKNIEPEDSSLALGSVSKVVMNQVNVDQVALEICRDEEPYVDDIPFDTLELVNSKKNSVNNEKDEKPYSFFDFLIRWIALLINSL